MKFAIEENNLGKQREQINIEKNQNKMIALITNTEDLQERMKMMMR